jgi:hypothetical protein
MQAILWRKAIHDMVLDISCGHTVSSSNNQAESSAIIMLMLSMHAEDQHAVRARRPAQRATSTNRGTCTTG